MTDKRMLIVPAELVRLIDENRGDLGQAEFIELLIENHFKGEARGEASGISREEFEALKGDLKKLLGKDTKFASKDDLATFQEDTKKLLKSFVDFFVGYGLELGKQSPSSTLEELSKLGLETKSAPGEGGEVKLKWK